MPTAQRGSWATFFPFLQARSYVSLPGDEDHQNGDRNGAEKDHDFRSAARSTLPFFLLRVLPVLVISICIVSTVGFFSKPIPNSSDHLTGQPNLQPIPASHALDDEKLSVDPLDEPSILGTDRPPRKALVLASYMKQHVDWLSEVPIDWEIYRYVMDSLNPTSGLTVPRNQGREAMVYLTYIIDHYDDLPDFVIFHHGHRRAWHQIEPTPMKLRALNLTALSQEQYVNLRCTHNPGCTSSTGIDLVHEDPLDNRTHAHMLPRFWNTMFGEESPWDMGPPPTNISTACCAQFAVTKEAILARPLEFWRAYRRPLEGDLEDYTPIWGENTTSYFVGICYEKIWHMVFGKPAVHCPAEDYCHSTLWSDAIVCDRYIGDYDHADGWQSVECVERWQD